MLNQARSIAWCVRLPSTRVVTMKQSYCEHDAAASWPFFCFAAGRMRPGEEAAFEAISANREQLPE